MQFGYSPVIVEHKMFENNSHIHVYIPKAGTGVPLDPNLYVNIAFNHFDQLLYMFSNNFSNKFPHLNAWHTKF